MESSQNTAHIHIVVKDSLRVFCKLLYLWFCVFKGSVKKPSVTKILQAICYLREITIISTNLVTTCSFVETNFIYIYIYIFILNYIK